MRKTLTTWIRNRLHKDKCNPLFCVPCKDCSRVMDDRKETMYLVELPDRTFVVCYSCMQKYINRY